MRIFDFRRKVLKHTSNTNQEKKINSLFYLCDNKSYPRCLGGNLLTQETLETWVQSLGQEDALEEEMATHSSILAWRIPWTEEPSSPWDHKELDTT